jgi:hypothetical protein
MSMNQGKKRLRAVAALCGMGMLFQFGGCDLGQFQATTVTVLDGRQVIISILRSAILTPIDQYITTAVNNFFEDDE